MSGRSPTSPVMERRYAPSSDACTRAIRLVLEIKKAAEPAPELNGHDDAKESHGRIATDKHTSK